jgi:hypothetical protein
MAEFNVRCTKPDGSLGLFVVRWAFSLDDAITHAKVIMAQAGFPNAELWRGDELVTRLLAPICPTAA